MSRERTTAPAVDASRDRLQDRRALQGSVIAVLVVAALCYAHTLDVPWYLDDVDAIVKNPRVHDLRAALGGLFASRGLGNLSFALNVATTGLALGPFHATNVAIHLAAGALALLVLRRAFPSSPALALFGALVFVAHPLQTQAVTYVAQRYASLAAMLCLAATWLYLRAREALDDGAPSASARFALPYAGALVCGGAAMLAKENAATLPVLLALCELILRPPAGVRASLRRLLWVAPFAVVPAIFALRTLGIWPLSAAGAAGAPAPGPSPVLAPFEADVVGGPLAATPLAYLFTEFEVIWRYLRLVVWPSGQMLDAGMVVSPVAFRPAAIAAGAGLLGLVAGALAVRRRAPLLTFGVLWFLVALSVESSVIPLDPYFEHRVYLPMLGAAAAAAWALGAAIPAARARAAVALLLVGVLSALTWARNAQWRDPAALWAADLAAGSASYRSATGLADAYHAAGAHDRARQVYADLLARGARRCEGGGCGGKYLLNLGVAAERLGDLDAAAGFYARALQTEPSYAIAHLGLGVVAYRTGRKAEALERFREAARLSPGDVVALTNWCTVALELGDPGPAERSLPRIRAQDPRRAAELEQELAKARAAGPSPAPR